ncbi:hypothetical protein B0T24DRAFT_626199, partial [Lasiosphaeria ovina]
MHIRAMSQFHALLSRLPGWRSWRLRSQPVATPEIVLATPGQTIGAETLAMSSQIEDYPSGYPQYSALVSSHDPFFAFRSFRRLRA